MLHILSKKHTGNREVSMETKPGLTGAAASRECKRGAHIIHGYSGARDPEGKPGRYPLLSYSPNGAYFRGSPKSL